MARPSHEPSQEDLVKVPKKSYKKGDLPDTEDGWVRHIREVHAGGLAARQKWELQWVLNLAYSMGYQNLLFDPRTGILRIPSDAKQPLSVNRLGAFIDSRHAKLTKQRPIGRVIPNTTDPDDKRAAKYADHALVYLQRKILMEQEQDKETMMRCLFGTAFMKTIWDPRSGHVIEDLKKSEDGMDLIVGDDGDLEVDKIFEGEVSTKALSPFAICPANDAIPTVKDQPFLTEDMHLSLGEVEEIYPHLRGRLQMQESDEEFTHYERVAQRLGSPFFHQTGQQGYHFNLNTPVRLTAYWQKPNYQFEKGVLAVLVQDKLAMIDVWPNDYGDNIYPHVRFVERETGLHFWGQSTAERLIPVQRAYNRIRQAVDRNASIMAKGKWMVAKGAQLQPDALDDDSGEVVEWNPAVPEPRQAPIAPLPNYVMNHQESLIVDFRDVGGQRETSTNPGNNLTAGVAMQMQAEMTDEVMGPLIRRQGFSLQLVGNTQLHLIGQEWQEPRMVKVFGEQTVGVMWISGADLKHHTDLHIEVESMYPDFRGAKRQTLIDLWDRRIVQDPKKFLQCFRFGDWDVLLDEQDALEDQVVIDIKAMKDGKQPLINPFQNHLLYFQKLSEFVQTPEFLRLEPDRKQIFLQNIQMHLQFLIPSLPGGGAPMTEQNQNAVGTPSGPQVPVGAQ